jgi:hypothetical protein
MDITQLKILLEETQQKFPPHYPTKTHGITDEVPVLLNNLKKVVDYIGFSNANIAIKNIVGKAINEFLISTREKLNKTSCDFNAKSETLENGSNIILEYNGKSLEITYSNNGTITIKNNFYCQYNAYGEDYSNSIISYNVNKPDEMFLNQTFYNKSVCQSIMSFDDNGIEISKDFKIIPNARNFKATNQFISGSIVRNNDFYSANIKLQITGDDFGNLITQNDILKIKTMKEITVPINYFGGLRNDLNLLCVVNNDERSNFRCGSIGELVSSYIYAEEEQETFEEEYEECKKVIEYSNFLEFAYNSLAISLPMIHAPYSFEILKNIKSHVHKQENSQHLK